MLFIVLLLGLRLIGLLLLLVVLSLFALKQQILFIVLNFRNNLLLILDFKLVDIVECFDHPIEILFLMQVQDNVVSGLFLHFLFGFREFGLKLVCILFFEDIVYLAAEKFQVVFAGFVKFESLLEC